MGNKFKKNILNEEPEELTEKDGAAPCPFCDDVGLELIVNGYLRGQVKLYAVQCEWCGARGGRRPTKGDAIKKWNTIAER